MCSKVALLKTCILLICLQDLQEEAFGSSSDSGVLIGHGARMEANILKKRFPEKKKNANPLYKETVPPPGMQPGRKVTIKGIPHSDANRFRVDLADVSGNVGLHISFRFPEEKTLFTTFENGKWQDGDMYDELAMKRGEEFKINILANENFFDVKVNGNSYKFNHRRPLGDLDILRIEDDVVITAVNWNLILSNL